MLHFKGGFVIYRQATILFLYFSQYFFMALCFTLSWMDGDTNIISFENRVFTRVFFFCSARIIGLLLTRFPPLFLPYYAGHCHERHHTTSAEGELQWCLHCLWINGHWSSSDYTVKPTFDWWSLSGWHNISLLHLRYYVNHEIWKYKCFLVFELFCFFLYSLVCLKWKLGNCQLHSRAVCLVIKFDGYCCKLNMLH